MAEHKQKLKEREKQIEEKLTSTAEASKDELEKVAESQAEETGAVQQDDSQLIAVAVDMVPTNASLPCSLYICVAGKYVLFRNQGERFSNQRQLKLQTQGVGTIYVHKLFWNIFLKTLEDMALDYKNEEEKMNYMRHLLVAYGQELDKKLKSPKKPAFDKMRKISEAIVDDMVKNRNLGVKMLTQNIDPVLYFVNHSVNVSIYSTLIGMRLECNLTDLKHLCFGGLVHDIGNLFLPKRILMKTEPLNEQEEVELKKHTRMGAELLQQVCAPPPAVVIAHRHHERWDGSGYPNGLYQDDIPVLARIVAIADAFDDLTSSRPGQQARSKEEALEQIKQEEGQFDPEIIEAIKDEDLPLPSSSTKAAA